MKGFKYQITVATLLSKDKGNGNILVLVLV